jgi:outer membrane protein OmpA-like peptidoglycan-associated protein
VERPYTLQEITRSERLRDKVRRIDLDTITFEFGSSTIGTDQMGELGRLGQAIEQVLSENPNSVFLIEGHTDKVGSDYDNLLLSDRRAEAVAVALSQNFDIPPENLVTEGYGEQYPKVPTEAAERQNRRVTMRNITELMAASN